jgi:putative peptidoglycan lipid II flippase
LERFTSTLKGAALLLIFLTILAKGLGFLREILFANWFGAGRDYEIYLIASILPITVNNIIYYIAQNYFIPKYSNIKSNFQGKEAVFTSGIFWFFTGIFFIISLVLYFSADTIISYYTGTSGVLNIKAETIFKILLISLPINAGFSILAGYLNAEFKYSYPALSQLFSGTVQILTFLILFNQIGIYIIPVGLLAGYIVQLVYLYIYSHKKIKIRIKYESFSFIRINSSGSFIFFLIVIEVLNQFYAIFDRYYYHQVEEGGIAALHYAGTIFHLPLSIVSFGLATIIFPKIAEAFSRQNYAELKSFYKKSLFYNALIYIPVVIILFFFGEFIIRMLFERGMFTELNTHQTFSVLQIYTLSLLFYSSYALINKMIFSMNMVKQLLVLSVVTIAIKIILNALLVYKYQQNGLAISSAVSYIFISISGFLLVQRKLQLYEKI